MFVVLVAALVRVDERQVELLELVSSSQTPPRVRESCETPLPSPKLPRDLHRPLVHVAGQQLAVLVEGARHRKRRVP